MKNDNSQVFPVDDDLRIREELVSIHAINPLVANNSSARSYMSSSHISQSLTLINGNERIIQTGIDNQLGDNTFSKKVEDDCRVLKVIHRYDGIDARSVSAVTSQLLVVENIQSGEIDVIDIPYHFSLHQYFGFKYKWNKELLSTLMYGDIIPGGTVLADSPSVAPNKGYKFGLNANIALMTIPEVSEDGVVISKSMSERLAYKLFETRVVEFGTDTFPLNIYGDDTVYKPFPEIGEQINDSSVVMVLRDYNPDLSAALTSRKDVREFNPIFDKAVYVKGPGKEELVCGDVVKSGVIVDIKAYHSPRFKKEVYTNTSDSVMKYVNGLKRYYANIIDTYETLQKDHYKRYRNNDLAVSEKFHRLLMDAYAIVNPDDNKIRYSFRNEQLDIYRLEFVIEYTILPGIGSKITDLSGSKGVVIEVRPDDQMPVDQFGNRADIIMDPSSIPSRMNVARLYEQYFNAMSRYTKKMVINHFISKGHNGNTLSPIEAYSDENISHGFDIVLGLLKIIGTEQYDTYRNLCNDQDAMRYLLKDIIENELYIYYKVSSKKKPYQIVKESLGTMYEPEMGSLLYISENGIKLTKDAMFIAPMYFILLAKTADNFLSSASAKTNHYGLPIGVSNKSRHLMPFRNSPVKTLSETETRLYGAYASRLALIELKDRGNSIDTHAAIYHNILTTRYPTNIDRVIDRSIHPYGKDSALEIVDNIFKASGIEIGYVHDKDKIHPIKH